MLTNISISIKFPNVGIAFLVSNGFFMVFLDIHLINPIPRMYEIPRKLNSTNQGTQLNMAIEIVDFPIKNCDFP